MAHTIRPSEFIDQLPETSIIRASDGLSYYRRRVAAGGNTWSKVERGEKNIRATDIPLPVTVLYTPGVAA